MPFKQTLDNWKQWGFDMRPGIKHEYSSGLSHQVYLVEDHGIERVLKVYSDDAREIASSIAIQQRAALDNLAPKIIRSGADYCLMELIKNDTEADSLQALKSTATALKKLHSLRIYIGNQKPPKQSPHHTNLSGPFSGHPEVTSSHPDTTSSHPERSEGSKNLNPSTITSFNLQAHCNNYLSQLNDPALTEQHSSLKPALAFFTNDTTEHCLCHNDLVKENIITNSTTTKFIDWDYAQTNNPWFDIASVVVYQQLNLDDQHVFLENYQPGHARLINAAVFLAAQIAVLWLDLLWRRVEGVACSGLDTKARLAECIQSLEEKMA